MIKAQKLIPSGFTVGLLAVGVLALSAPASARGAAVVAAVRIVHTDRVAPRLLCFWIAPQLAARSGAIAPSPANQSAGPPAIPLAIVASRSATWISGGSNGPMLVSLDCAIRPRMLSWFSHAGSCHELALAIFER
jgi:hypothetical protein